MAASSKSIIIYSVVSVTNIILFLVSFLLFYLYVEKIFHFFWMIILFIIIQSIADVLYNHYNIEACENNNFNDLSEYTIHGKIFEAISSTNNINDGQMHVNTAGTIITVKLKGLIEPFFTGDLIILTNSSGSNPSTYKVTGPSSYSSGIISIPVQSVTNLSS